MLLQELVQALANFAAFAGGRTDNPRKARQPRLQVESLENRRVLAGEVWVEVDAAGDLRITGDGQANDVEIVQVSAEKLAVIGRDQTRINGELDGYLTFPRTTRGVIVDLRGGDDHLVIGSMEGPQAPQTQFLGDLRVLTGQGSDKVRIVNVAVRRNAWLDTGADADLVEVSRGSFGGLLSINTGAGDDPDQALLQSVRVMDDLAIWTHGGDDFVSFHVVAVDDDLMIETGAGADRVATFFLGADELFVKLGDGDDQVRASFISTRRTVLDGEQGAADQFVDVLLLGQSSNQFGQWIKRGFELERLAGQ